jgi:TetR/AcrR family transcriptional repressor of nem operon
MQTTHQSKTRLLNAALHVIRAKGYNATRVEDVCEAANLTKGSFFHHFQSKEDLALAAAAHWNEITGGLFQTAPYHQPTDPRERLLAYIDFRRNLLQGDLPDFTCLLGTMVQEIYDTNPAIRQSCEQGIYSHAATLEPHIAEAMRVYNIHANWTPHSLALYTQAVIQGAFILAKAEGGVAPAIDALAHLRRHIELLFPEAQKPAEFQPKKERTQ